MYLATIVQGRYDVVCPPITAWELHQAWPESKLHWVHDAGHSATVSFEQQQWAGIGERERAVTDTRQEPGTKQKLIEACDEYAALDV